jgi:hypothetical protein
MMKVYQWLGRLAARLLIVAATQQVAEISCA